MGAARAGWRREFSAESAAHAKTLRLERCWGGGEAPETRKGKPRSRFQAPGSQGADCVPGTQQPGSSPRARALTPLRVPPATCSPTAGLTHPSTLSSQGNSSPLLISSRSALAVWVETSQQLHFRGASSKVPTAQAIYTCLGHCTIATREGRAPRTGTGRTASFWHCPTPHPRCWAAGPCWCAQWGSRGDWAQDTHVVAPLSCSGPPGPLSHKLGGASLAFGEQAPSCDSPLPCLGKSCLVSRVGASSGLELPGCSLPILLPPLPPRREGAQPRGA